MECLQVTTLSNLATIHRRECNEKHKLAKNLAAYVAAGVSFSHLIIV